MFRLRLGLGLLAIVAISGCGSAATPTGQAPTRAPASAVGTLGAPGAPTGLKETIVESADGSSAAADFSWQPGAGEIDGYYFFVVGTYVDQNGNGMTLPPEKLKCDATWTKLPAGPTTYELPSVESEPQAYLCAFNSAGTSPTVQFPMPAS
jgi:hypothetical protein